MKKVLIILSLLSIFPFYTIFAQNPGDQIYVEGQTWNNSNRLRMLIKYNTETELNKCLNQGETVNIDAGSALYGTFTFKSIDSRYFQVATNFYGVFNVGTLNLKRGLWRAWFDDYGKKGTIPNSLISIWVKVETDKVTIKFYFTKVVLQTIVLTPSDPTETVSNFIGTFTFTLKYLDATKATIQTDMTSSYFGTGTSLMTFPNGVTAVGFNPESRSEPENCPK